MNHRMKERKNRKGESRIINQSNADNVGGGRGWGNASRGNKTSNARGKKRGGINKCINKRKGKICKKCSLFKDSSQIVDAPFLRHSRDGNILMFINPRQATQQKPGLALSNLKPLH